MPENYAPNPENRVPDYATWEGTMIPNVRPQTPPQPGRIPTVPLALATAGLAAYALLHGRKPKVPLFKGDLGYLAEHEHQTMQDILSNLNPPKVASAIPNIVGMIEALGSISRG